MPQQQRGSDGGASRRLRPHEMPDYIALLNMDWPADSAIPSSSSSMAGTHTSSSSSSNHHHQQQPLQQQRPSNALRLPGPAPARPEAPPPSRRSLLPTAADELASASASAPPTEPPAPAPTPNDLDFWLNANFDFDEDGFNRDLGIAASKYNAEVDLASLVGAAQASVAAASSTAAGPPPPLSSDSTLLATLQRPISPSSATPAPHPLHQSAATPSESSTLAPPDAAQAQHMQTHLSIVAALNSNPVALHHYLAAIGQASHPTNHPQQHLPHLHHPHLDHQSISSASHHVPPVAAAAAAALSQAAMPALIAASLRHQSQFHTANPPAFPPNPPSLSTPVDPGYIAQRMLLQDSASLQLSLADQHHAALSALSPRNLAATSNLSTATTQNPPIALSPPAASATSTPLITRENNVPHNQDRKMSSASQPNANDHNNANANSNSDSKGKRPASDDIDGADNSIPPTSNDGDNNDGTTSGRVDADEMDKRRRNTIASARFRAKKKAREQAMEQTAREMTARVETLEMRLREKDVEIKWLRQLLTDRDGPTRLREAYRSHGIEYIDTAFNGDSASTSVPTTSMVHSAEFVMADMSMPPLCNDYATAIIPAESIDMSSVQHVPSGPFTRSSSEFLLDATSAPITAEQLASAVAYAMRASQQRQQHQQQPHSSSESVANQEQNPHVISKEGSYGRHKRS